MKPTSRHKSHYNLTYSDEALAPAISNPHSKKLATSNHDTTPKFYFVQQGVLWYAIDTMNEPTDCQYAKLITSAEEVEKTITSDYFIMPKVLMMTSQHGSHLH